MVREMLADANDSRVEAIRQVNTAGHIGAGFGAVVAAGGVACGNPIVASIGAATALGGGVAYLGGFGSFYNLVKDHGPFDPKHKIKERLGKGITLGNQNDIEYSVPGNILYGFVGTSIGYIDQILYIGGGVAEIRDPSHDPAIAAERGVDYTPYAGDKSAPYYGDTHGDHNAIAFGVHLYKTYRMGLTLSLFRTELSGYISGFDRNPPDTFLVKPEYASKWPYLAGYFDPTK